MHDGRVERRGGLDYLIMGTLHARAAENGDGLCGVKAVAWQTVHAANAADPQC